jgi:hypothetical protein
MLEFDRLGSIVVIVLMLAAVCESISGHLRWSMIETLLNCVTQWVEFG